MQADVAVAKFPSASSAEVDLVAAASFHVSHAYYGTAGKSLVAYSTTDDVAANSYKLQLINADGTTSGNAVETSNTCTTTALGCATLC
jgi:hypothetical protein